MTARQQRRRRDDRLRALALAAGDLARWHATLAADDPYSRGLHDAYADVAQVLGGLLGIVHVDNDCDARLQPLPGHEG